MKRRSSQHRNGAVLIAALVCLLIVTAMLATMIQNTLRAQRQLHRQRDARQTELLLQAGADLASRRLATGADYRGETWSVPAEAFAGRGAAVVTITASRETDDSPWLVRVAAEYPAGNDWSIRRSRAFALPASISQVQE